MIQEFNEGDRVRIEGVDGEHIIKDIGVRPLPIGWIAVVTMEDGLIGMVDSSGWTDMTKV